MDKEEIFWSWFKENNSSYYYLNQISDKEEKEKFLDAFLKELHKYCDQLYFEIGGYPNEPQELIISAEGNKDYFNHVESLVAKAPALEDWQIIAFKPPMGVDFVTEYEGHILDPRKIWFLPLEINNDPQSLGLRVCVPNYTSENQKSLLAGCYQMLDVILGEKSTSLELQYVEVDKLPVDPEKEGLIEVIELPEYIQWKKRNGL